MITGMTHQWSKFQYAIANPQVRAEIGRAVRDGIPVEQPAADFEKSRSAPPPSEWSACDVEGLAEEG